MSWQMDPEMLRETAKKLAAEQIEKTGGPEKLFRSFIEGGSPDQAKQQRAEEVNQERVFEERQKMKNILHAASTVVCDSCSGYTFTQVCVMKKVSALISPSGEEQTVPLATWQCASCSHINEEFLPQAIISDLKKEEEKKEKPKRKRQSKKS